MGAYAVVVVDVATRRVSSSTRSGMDVASARQTARRQRLGLPVDRDRLGRDRLEGTPVALAVAGTPARNYCKGTPVHRDSCVAISWQELRCTGSLGAGSLHVCTIAGSRLAHGMNARLTCRVHSGTPAGDSPGADPLHRTHANVGSSRVDLQACKLEYSIVSPK